MNQTCLVQKGQTIQELLCENPDQCGAKTPELVLLDQFIQIDAEKLKDQAQMLSMDESVLEPQEVMVVVFVKLGVELMLVSTVSRGNSTRTSLPSPGLILPSYFG